MAKATRWIPLFERFIKPLRIASKEVAAIDEFGSPLNLWLSQQMFLDGLAQGLEDGVRIFYVLKARQLGVTTVSLAIDIFWLSIHPSTIGALVCDTDTNRDVFRQTIGRYIGSMKKFMGSSFTIKKDNRSFMEFSNGSRLDFIVAGTRKANWGEGRGYSFAHLTEIASYGDPAGLASFRETLAETHPDRLFIYEGTAKGPNHWKDMWEEARRDTHTKRGIFIGWWAKQINSIAATDPRFPVYGVSPASGKEIERIRMVEQRYGHVVTDEQLAWYRWRDSDTSATEKDTHQNLPWVEEEAFVNEGFSFFQIKLVQKDIDRVTHPEHPVPFAGYKMILGNNFLAAKMERITDYERIDEVELRIWEEPIKGAQYCIGCDPAFGRNDWKDRTAIEVYRCYADKLVQVAEFASPDYETHQCAWVLAYLAGAYRDCIVTVELTGGPGRAVMREFETLRTTLKAEMHERDVAERDWDDFLGNARWYLYHRPDAMGAGYAYNIDTSNSNKWTMMNHMRDSYTLRYLVINSAPCLEEMAIVVQDGPQIHAPGRGKDDRVMASVFANLAWIEWVRPSMIANGMTYQAVVELESGTRSDGQQIVDRLVRNYFKRREAEIEEEDNRSFLEMRGLN